MVDAAFLVKSLTNYHHVKEVRIRSFSFPSFSVFNSFMTEVPIIEKPVDSFALKINGLVSI